MYTIYSMLYKIIDNSWIKRRFYNALQQLDQWQKLCSESDFMRYQLYVKYRSYVNEEPVCIEIWMMITELMERIAGSCKRNWRLTLVISVYRILSNEQFRVGSYLKCHIVEIFAEWHGNIVRSFQYFCHFHCSLNQYLLFHQCFTKSRIYIPNLNIWRLIQQ